MTSANVNDRASLERIYPRDAFEQDCRENARADNSVVNGVRILSALDASGGFEVARARQHVGEGDPEGDTVFLAPSLAEAQAGLKVGAGYGGAEETGAAPATGGDRSRYDRFLDALADAARSADFKPAIGKGEDRLRGFHGG